MWFILAASAQPFAVDLTWGRDGSRLHVVPAVGYEIAPDAPVDLEVTLDERVLSLQMDGLALDGGTPIDIPSETTVSGRFDLQVCEKAGGACRPATATFSATRGTKKKGRVQATVIEDSAFHHTFNQDAVIASGLSFEAAKATGDRVLLDFSAVWCPPCNLLAAEVLHADDADEVLEGFQVAVVDVDHFSSLHLKDRYKVGSYPTVVVTDADGKELDRVVGYPGRERFLDFLSQLDTPSPEWETLDPSILDPDEAARGFLALTSTDVDLSPWALASASSDTVDAHLARMHHEANDTTAATLLTRYPKRIFDWLGDVDPWLEAGGTKVVERHLPGLLVDLPPVESADVLWMTAQWTEDPTVRSLRYAQAANTLTASLTGDFSVDRAHLGFLATLVDGAGRTDDAIAHLDRLTREHPDEPTFALKAANLLNGHERYEEAWRRADVALQRSWGDNRLRVVHAGCTALAGLGRTEEAHKLAEKALEETEVNTDLDVRTHRYRKKLEPFLR